MVGRTLGADPKQPELAPVPAIAAALAQAWVNPGGRALARRHPTGASGAVRLFHGLTSGIGLAAIASAGGIGSALVVQR